jgi:autotransporter-associated beta strand protein
MKSCIRSLFTPSQNARLLRCYYYAALSAVCSVLFAPSIVQAQTWNLAAGGSWNTAGNWSPASIPNGVGASVTCNSAASGSNIAQTGNSALTLDGSKTVGAITFNNDSGSTFTYAINTGTGGPLIFDAAGAGPASITVNSTSGSTGNDTISVATTLNDDVIVTVNNITATSANGALNLSTTMSGAGGLTKNGDGLITLGSNAKNYTGATVLNAGRTRITQVGQPAKTSSVTINAGAQMTLNTGGNYAMGSGPIYMNGTGASNPPFSQFLGAMRNDRNTAPITISNSIVFQSDVIIHVQANNGTGGSATPGATNILAGNISGPGHLTFTAPTSDVDQGFLVFYGANSYSGGTLVNGGILVAEGASATFGAGDVTIDHAASPSSIARGIIRSGVVNAIADTATLSLSGGGSPGVADQGWIILESGVNETVGDLKLAGVLQPAGTYGSSLSSAIHTNDEFFAGPGILTVLARSLPRLDIAVAAPSVTLSWPTNAAGFTLQQVDSLLGSWADDTNTVTPSGTNYLVTETVTGTNKFFRLRR